MRSPVAARHAASVLGTAVVTLGLFALPAGAQDAGFGKDIPLNMAVKQIVPDGYTVQMGPGVDSKTAVSWNGGGWRQAITSAAKGGGYNVSITGETVRIMRGGGPKVVEATETEGKAATTSSAPEDKVRRARREAVERAEARIRERPARAAERRGVEGRHAERTPAPRRPRPAVAEETVSGGGFVMVPVRVAEPSVERVVTRRAVTVADAGPAAAPPPVPRAPEWTVREGDNLQSILRDWSAREGWRLVWESEFKYQIGAPARFQGDFVGATSDLLKSMEQVRPLVTASFYRGNKTLVVRNGSSDGAAP